MGAVKHLEADDASADQVVAAIEDDGACIVEHMLDPSEVASIRSSLLDVLQATPAGRNEFEGFKTQRIYAVFAKTRALDGAATHPLVTAVLDRILGHYQLSAPVGIHIGPGEQAQVLHYDQVVYPLPRDFRDVVVNTMWAFDDFTQANGATRFLPGSHRSPTPGCPDGDPVQALMPAGSVLFYGGKLWHGGGANTTDRARLGVILEYVAAWIRPQENHILAVPRDVAAALPERLQELLGYNVYPPFVGNVDGRHPRRYILEPVRPPQPGRTDPTPADG